MKHFNIIVVVLVAFLVSSAFAGDNGKISVFKAETNEDQIIVPIALENSVAMTGMELPLKYSDGVILRSVTFEGTRSESFDLQVANILADQNKVILALIPMVYGDKGDLEPGNGVIANLVFDVIDPEITEVEITPTTTESPNHEMLFVYQNPNGTDLISTTPAFEGITVEFGDDALNVPSTFELHQNYPNPFNPSTTIMLDLPNPAHVRLDVFNVLGQSVKTLKDEQMDAGYHPVEWNGTDNSGSPVATGIYFYKIQAGERIETKKMMLLK
jgi:hypothetical protein